MKLPNPLILDTEFSKLVNNNRNTSRLVLVGISDVHGKHFQQFIIDHNDRSDFDAKKRLQRAFRSYHGTIIGHNLPFDIGILLAHGFTFNHTSCQDTYLFLRCTNENETRADLKTWATYLGFPPYWLEFEEFLKTSDTQFYPIKKLLRYNKYDLEATAALYKYIKNRVTSPKVLQLENEIAPLAAAMGNHGLKLSKSKLQEHYEKTIAERDLIEHKIQKKYHTHINFNSPVQVAHLLYDTLRIPEIQGRTTKEAILHLIRHPIGKMLVGRRKCTKLITSYLAPMLKLLPIVYGNAMQHGTESTRFTIRKPALQTVPEKIRDIFVPQLGCFVWADLDQIEAKILICLAKDKHLIRALLKGEDMHSATAKKLFGKVNDKLRKVAKTLRYGVIYGASPGKVASKAGIRYNEAREYIEAFFEDSPEIVNYRDKIHKKVEKTGKVRTVFGFHRNFMTKPKSEEQFYALLREGFNVIMQSMGHMITLVFWLLLHKKLVKHKLYPKYVRYALENHDELLLDVKLPKREQVIGLCKAALAKINSECYNRFGYKFKVPITGSVKSGRKWI